MDKKTLVDLDYFRIRDEIANFCVSEESRFLFSRIEPMTERSQIIDFKNLSSDWFSFLEAKKQSCLYSWNPVFALLKSMAVSGCVLSIEDIYFIGQFCISVKKLVECVQDSDLLKNIEFFLKRLPFSSVVSTYDEIFRIINFEGELRDLSELREIKQKISSLNVKIKNIMKSFTSNQKYIDILETNVPVLRSNRQVLAVKSNRRNLIPGIIHEVSASGQTVYIEPEECVLASNELIEAEAQLLAVTRKILLELTERISGYSGDLIFALKLMEKIDCAYAAARWGRENNCVFADFCDDEEPLLLLGARHPLLGEKCVPIDVRFIENKRVLIISGPNTGGKTVTLKTIALFSLLNQSGFPIPAKEGTRLPIFKSVFADIGDEQNIDESLSTFSAHMKNISKAVKCADDFSLVLLDELGSATDPQEGAAISMAVLDSLIEKNAFVIITTHQGAIKNYGYTHEKCINASVEFSSDTLSPTYTILMGVPGESHALDIAKKSGLPKIIVDNAKEYLVNEKADVSALIKGLTQKHIEVEKLRSDYEEKVVALEEKIYKNEKKSLELNQKEHELKSNYHSQSEEFLKETRSRLENLVRVLREGEINREKTLSVRDFISDFTQKVKRNEEELQQENQILLEETERIEKIEKKRVSHKVTKRRIKSKEALLHASSIFENKSIDKKNEKRLPLKEFAVNAQVVHSLSKKQGTLVCNMGKGVWQVQFGSIIMNVKQNELRLVEEPRKVNFNFADYIIEFDKRKQSEADEKPVFELRLLGMRAEEALNALEHQIDLCVLNNFRNFSVIHGKGTGVLQEAVQEYLKKSIYVKNFSFAPPEDGGFGKTYVELS